MKKILPLILVCGLLSSCAVKTVSRTELFTPTLYTAVNSDELTDMKYYGADDQYDYFTRSISRYRVLRSENAVPASARFEFNNWQGGKLYRECLKDTAASKVSSSISNLLQNIRAAQ